MSGKDIETARVERAPRPGTAERAPWERPRVDKMAAGDAENAFTQAVDDGQFTRS